MVGPSQKDRGSYHSDKATLSKILTVSAAGPRSRDMADINRVKCLDERNESIPSAS